MDCTVIDTVMFWTDNIGDSRGGRVSKSFLSVILQRPGNPPVIVNLSWRQRYFNHAFVIAKLQLVIAILGPISKFHRSVCQSISRQSVTGSSLFSTQFCHHHIEVCHKLLTRVTTFNFIHFTHTEKKAPPCISRQSVQVVNRSLQAGVFPHHLENGAGEAPSEVVQFWTAPFLIITHLDPIYRF